MNAAPVGANRFAQVKTRTNVPGLGRFFSGIDALVAEK